MAETSWGWLDGHIAPLAELQIEVQNRGFLLGDGIFETILWHQGRAIAWDLHWQRMLQSAQWFDLPVQYEVDEILMALATLAQQVGTESVALRLTLTRASGGRGLVVAENATNLLLSAQPYEISAQPPARVMWAREPRSTGGTEAAHKTLGMVNLVRWRQQAVRQGYDEVLLYDERGNLLEASAANVLVWRAGSIHTPPADGSILPGVTRALWKQFAQQQGIDFVEKPIARREIDTNCALILCNTLQISRQVSHIEEQEMSSHKIETIKELFCEWVLSC